MRIFVRLMFFAVATFALGGCGIPAQTDFPNALTGPDGEAILFDDVSEILSDPDLTDDEKRDALRLLGLEDEKLIDALIAA
jgi:hypothetical protein